MSGSPLSDSEEAVAVGLGCDRGTPLVTLHQALVLAGVPLARVVSAASISLKADEPGLLALAQCLGWQLVFYTPETLACVPVPNPSDTVLRHIGTPSVSEAAALLAGAAVLGRATPLPGQALLVEKFNHCGADGRNATVSIARCDRFLFPQP